MGERHKTANGSVVSWHRDMRNSSSINRRSPSSPIGRKNHSEITRAHGCLDDGFRLPAGSRIVINISLASAGVAVGLRVAGDDLYGHESEMEFLTEGDRRPGSQRPRRDRRGDDVGGVVEAVGEIEGERSGDDDDEQERSEERRAGK